MHHLVVFTGAGMSAESGIPVFRGADGLWEKHDLMEVASFKGWLKDPELVQRFYNERRRQLARVEPNQGHIQLAALEKYFRVSIITQNIDNLHERAGSTSILHLHGELTKARSTIDPAYIKEIGYEDIQPGELCPHGGQLRPHIVWFGEAVPAMEKAMELAAGADIFVVIGTSLNVYPAAGLVDFIPPRAFFCLIDPVRPENFLRRNYEFIREKAGTGVGILTRKLIALYRPGTDGEQTGRIPGE